MTKITEIVLDASIDPISAPETQAEFALNNAPGYQWIENNVGSFTILRTIRIDQTLTVDWALINLSVIPTFGTVTFNPGDTEKTITPITLEVSTTENGTVEIANPQYVSGPFSNPILIAPISAPVNIQNQTPTIDPIPNFNLSIGQTHDMSQYINDVAGFVTGTDVLGLAGFATYDDGTELLTGISNGTESNIQLEVTFP